MSLLHNEITTITRHQHRCCEFFWNSHFVQHVPIAVSKDDMADTRTKSLSTKLFAKVALTTNLYLFC